MQAIREGFVGALMLILHGDAETYQIIGLSLFVSLTATLGAAILGVPLGILLGSRNFPGKKSVVHVVYTLMSVPPVIMGLFVLLMLSRKGPLGYLQLLYTPVAMIIAQIFLVTPIVTGVVYNATEGKGVSVRMLARTLGASRSDAFLLMLRELRMEILSGVVTGYGRAISEVGAVMIVGGNIKGHTRVMTTSIAMLQSMGRYDSAIAMGLVLLFLSFIVQAILLRCQRT